MGREITSGQPRFPLEFKTLSIVITTIITEKKPQITQNKIQS